MKKIVSLGLSAFLLASPLATTALADETDVVQDPTGEIVDETDVVQEPTYEIVDETEVEFTPEQKEILRDYEGIQSVTKPIENLSGTVSPGGTVTTSAAKTQYNRVTVKRGSWMAWSKAMVSFGYNKSKVTASSGDQDSGYVFPNIVKEKGMKKLETSTSSSHHWRSKTSIAIGTPTPWGDVKLVESSITDYIYVKKNGTHSVN